jgi:hypothetical protein
MKKSPSKIQTGRKQHCESSDLIPCLFNFLFPFLSFSLSCAYQKHFHGLKDIMDLWHFVESFASKIEKIDFVSSCNADGKNASLQIRKVQRTFHPRFEWIFEQFS